ncbi:hypothetical protein KIH74_22705 [Kineosporia sp. J2-2]|uniref:TrbC/VIRB2 family protein n=1 Tax=Kineosporia corallincola TaxID=2835133 RepID=A0ABS5TKZ0_9ACTN|nr:hypothetical protein [Kineosporia corallincola]MBT0771769.1 hypothetical protein [Kineosporia corallincola]
MNVISSSLAALAAGGGPSTSPLETWIENNVLPLVCIILAIAVAMAFKKGLGAALGVLAVMVVAGAIMSGAALDFGDKLAGLF